MAFDRNSPQAQITGLYGLIREAVEGYATTAQLWDKIRESQFTGNFGLVTQLRSSAAQTRNARQAFESASDTQAITANMIATAPWSRPVGERNLAPEYQLNIQYTYTDELGGEVTDWVAKKVPVLPIAVGDLVDYAQSFLVESDTGPQDASVTGAIEILAV